MLQSVSIKNFKAIGEVGLELNNLTNVNYLVGKNTSGKSSVLEVLTILKSLKNENIPEKNIDSVFLRTGEKWEFNRNCIEGMFTELSISGLEIYNFASKKVDSMSVSFSTFKQSGASNENYIEITQSELKQKILDRDFKHSALGYPFIFHLNPINKINNFIDTTNISPLVYKKYKNIVKLFIPEFETASSDQHIVIDEFLLDTYSISSGQKQILNIINSIFKSGFYSFNRSIFLIDEIDYGLHPSFSKLIPNLLNEISIININAPVQFIITTHSPFIISAAAEFSETQKVYLIEDGKCINPEGSSGYGAKKQANEMLGVGFNDYQKEIIICEGDGKVPDDDIYNQIFYDQKYFFVSAGSCTLLDKNTQLANSVLKKIFNKQIKFYLKDEDKKSKEEINTEKNIYKQQYKADLKFLKRYNLEAYIYDPEIVKLAFPDTDFEEYQGKFDSLMSSKFDHGENLSNIISKKLYGNISKKDIQNKLVEQIKKDTKVYKELYNCIFEN